MNEFQEQVFGFICRWKLDNDGISPSMSQIGDALKVTRSQAHYACKQLAEQGYIEIDEGRIKVVVGRWVAQGELRNDNLFTWLDTEGTLSDRIERAIHAYFVKHEKYPAFVFVHPGELDQQTSIIIDRSVVVSVVPNNIVRLMYNYKMQL